VLKYSEVSTNIAARAIALYRSMLRHIPVLASADDLPFVASAPWLAADPRVSKPEAWKIVS